MSGGLPETRPRSITVQELADVVPGARVVGDAAAAVTGVTYDSREVRDGSLFAALRGSDFDGHAYIPAALERRAGAILAERDVDADVPVIVVENTRAALAPISTAFYGDPSRELTMIGLTGTDGKTTTSYLVRHILEHAGIQTGVIGTVGIDLGDGTSHHLPHQTTPESNLLQGYLREMVKRGTSAAVLEATSHGLAMHRLDGTVFTIAGVTNITREHLEYHKTIDAYRRAKAILLERVAAEGGTVVLNADDEGARAVASYADGATVLWYSMADPTVEIFATNIDVSASGNEFDVVVNDDVVHVHLPMLGEFNIANALCAMGVSLAAGVSIAQSAEALASATGVPGRVNRIDQGQRFRVVVDYAHTPESMTKILSLLRRLHPEGRLITVFGSAGERDATKRPLQGEVAVTVGDVAVVTSEDPRNEDPDAIIREIADGSRRAGGVDGETVFEVTDRQEAIRLAYTLANPGDCVALLGKGHETSIIWGFEHRPWNEDAVAREELAAMGFPGEPA